eukprot:SAG11_NODE_3161_length_2642_cov_2.388124_2_plen_94_part_00
MAQLRVAAAALSALAALLIVGAAVVPGTVDGVGQQTAQVDMDWSATLTTTRTTATCQVVNEPGLWPTSPIREKLLHSLAQLGAEASPVFWQSW